MININFFIKSLQTFVSSCHTGANIPVLVVEEIIIKSGRWMTGIGFGHYGTLGGYC